MSKSLDENLGTVDYDGLIVTNEPVADVFTVTIPMCIRDSPSGR